jgi:hypothetical protein
MRVKVADDFIIECETTEDLNRVYRWWEQLKQSGPKRESSGASADRPKGSMVNGSGPSHPKAAPLLRYVLNGKSVRVRDLIARFELGHGRALGPIMSSIGAWAQSQSMDPDEVVVRRKSGKARFWDAGKRLEEAVALLPAG